MKFERNFEIGLVFLVIVCVVAFAGIIKAIDDAIHLDLEEISSKVGELELLVKKRSGS